MDENFVQLSWNAHHSALLENLSDLRDKQFLTDVMLSCGDDFYPAHRFVLSSCSSFLARALEVVNCPSPVLLLHGISQHTLEHLLMYMYDGQVTVKKTDLPQLLKAAHWLGVKGLESTYAHISSSVSESQNEDINKEQKDSSQLSDIWKELMVATDRKNVPLNLENIISSLQSEGSKVDDEISHDAQDPEEINDTTNDSLDTDGFPQHPSENDHSFEGWDNSNSVTVRTLIPNGQISGRSKRSLRCKHCKHSFTVRSELAKHVRMHHDSTQNYCFHCCENFASNEDFKIHMKIHSIDNWHNCEKCDFIGNTKKLLAKHMESHKGDSSLIEPSKEQSIISKLELDDKSMPIAVVKLEAIPIVKCNTCFKAFKGKKALLKHKIQNCCKITRSEEGFHCPLCNFTSTWKQCVQEHLGKHTNNLTFQCSYCPYQCRRAKVLEIHMGKRHPEENSGRGRFK